MASTPPRPSRAQSFLGIHHDFHARDIDIPVGQRTTPAMVQEIIDKVHPDYIQVDSKGHHGFTSYPTTVGNRAPVIVGDPLRIWRDVTAAAGVALYVHHSGVLDERAIELHPDWALIDAAGTASVKAVSVHSPYLEDLLLPQLHELIDVYDIDGVWIDGDCWGTALDYSPRALAAFRAETGISTVPRTPADEGYQAFVDFARESFRRYLRRYVDQVHVWNPRFQVASNWAFTSFMPEPITANVDFLSGDSAPIGRSYVRWEARSMALQGRPWDVMTWGFGGMFTLVGIAPVGMKSPIQLEQEAATILALGGGYQSVANQRLDGSINSWHLDVMAEVAEFCRARQTLCHNAALVPQVAFLHAGLASYEAKDPLFMSIGSVDGPLGILEALLASQNVVSMVMPHQLDDALMASYPLIVIPGWERLPAGMDRQLLAYVEGGGNLLVIGPDQAAIFADALDATFDGEIERDVVRFMEFDGQLDGHLGSYRAPRLGARAEERGRLRVEFDLTAESTVAASVAAYGKGRIAALYFDFGASYHGAVSAITRRYLQSLVRELFPEPIVTVTGSQFVDVVLTRIDGKTIVHLINTAGQGDNPRVHILDEIPSVGPLEVRVRVPGAASRVTLEPSGIVPEMAVEDGVIVVQVPRLEIHTMVVIEG